MNCPQRFARKAFLLLLLSGFTVLTANAQKHAYRLFREDGKKVKYEKMADAASGADIVLFGEYHTNPISHWLQLELTTDLFEARGEELILGAEMFEADNQLILNEYLAGMITEKKFEEEARLWKNYTTDYKPLVMIAKENELTFVATNIPRRYANMVFKRGVVSLDSLTDEAKSYIAPLPLEYDTSLNCYKQLLDAGSGPISKTPMAEAIKPMSDTITPMGEAKAPMGKTKMPMGSKSPMGGHGNTNMADAQAIKDATMTHFIMEHWQPGKLFIHYNGAYHSDEFESMYWFLKRANPDLKIITISTVSQDDIEKLEEESVGKADFIIAVPSNMTQTHR
ncbi:MAG: ChaN family lipoprotein [Bacteroidales bacterium]|nr:ChaN family lipoprotein [Bacteroidales bacterium]